MKIVVISNYYTHHQSELLKAFSASENVECIFIETDNMSEERKQMGWEIAKPEKVIDYEYYANHLDEIKALIIASDIVIHGSAPIELLKNRIKKRKLTFLYSERIYKKECKYYKYPLHYIRFWLQGKKCKNVYLLCAGSYTAADYYKTQTFVDRSYCWGYFPEVKRYDDIDKIIEWKHPASILWVARLIDWKHPETSIEVAKHLKADGYRFMMSLIGNGELEERLKERIAKEGLSDCVHMLGAMKPEQVREHMEQSEVFMFTSDRNEGWGAVLNEAMNSCCAVVASHAIGSVPFLLEDGVNGLIYKDGDIDGLYKKVKRLLDDRELRRRLGKNAYRTVSEVWSADEAAKRFLVLSNAILSGSKKPEPFSIGPCSKAKIIKDDWYNG